jgi:DNA-binding LytR/AlgR family response regulator
MFRIAICDDEYYFRQEFKDIISDYMRNKGLIFHIDTFASGEEFIALGIEMVKYTIVFLDVNMNKMDGVTAAKAIRMISKEIFIVFVTAYVDYTLEGYKVDSIRYLLKGSNNFKSTINECMEAVIDKMNYAIIKKAFHFNESKKEIALDRLLYIESKLHKLEFHIMEQNMKIYTMYETLNELEQELKHYNFVRIHQSFLVNMKYINRVFRYKTILSNGIELIIPKARYKQVKDSFIAFQGEI